MNLLELRNSLAQKDFSSLYIFYGKEYTILELYIQKIKNLLNITSVSSESVYSIYNSLNKKSMFEKSGTLYIVRDDKEFLSKEAIWKDLEQRLQKNNSYIICKYDNLDSRSKFSKQFDKNITEFVPLSKEVLTKYIKKDLDLNTDYCEYLCDICGNDYGRILLEMNKIKCYAKQMNTTHDKAFVICGKAGQFYQEPDSESFDLVRSVMSRDITSAYDNLKDSIERKDNPLMILTVLHGSFKNLLQYKLAENSKNIVQVTGLTPFQVKSCASYKTCYSVKEIIRALKYIKYCEKGVKGGTVPSDIMLDYLLVNIL